MLYQKQSLYKMETKTDRYGRWHRNNWGESSGGLLESSYSSEHCEKPREKLNVTVASRYQKRVTGWLTCSALLNVSCVVTRQHKKGYKFAMTSATQRLASSPLHGCNSSGTEGFFHSSGGKLCYDAQRCGGLRRLSVNATGSRLTEEQGEAITTKLFMQ